MSTMQTTGVTTMFDSLRTTMTAVLGQRRKTAARRMAKRWFGRSVKINKRLSSHLDKLHEFGMELEDLQRGLEDYYGRIVDDVKDARDLQKQQEEVVDALRSENKILGEVQMPAMTAALQLELERTRAEIDLQVRRQIAARSPRDEER